MKTVTLVVLGCCCMDAFAASTFVADKPGPSDAYRTIGGGDVADEINSFIVMSAAAIEH